jgi:uncharacterized membrane protein
MATDNIYVVGGLADANGDATEAGFDTLSVFRTNVIYGLLVLVPAAIIFLLLAKIVEILEKMAASLNFASDTGVIVAIMLGILLLLLLCFVVGSFVRTRIGSQNILGSTYVEGEGNDKDGR